MSFFVIDRKRLMIHLDYDIRKSPRGVLNWMMEDTGMLTLFLDIQGVRYVYREFFNRTSDIPVDIKCYLTSDRSIGGVIDYEDLIDKPEIGQEQNTIPEEFKDINIWGTGNLQ